MNFPSLPLHKLNRFAASGAVSAVPARVFGILLFGGSTASSVKLTNDANGAGTPILNVNIAIASSFFLDLSTIGPAAFDVACYATIAGTGAEVYIWWE